jgi:hypothetical protein
MQADVHEGNAIIDFGNEIGVSSPNNIHLRQPRRSNELDNNEKKKQIVSTKVKNKKSLNTSPVSPNRQKQ